MNTKYLTAIMAAALVGAAQAIEEFSGNTDPADFEGGAEGSEDTGHADASTVTSTTLDAEGLPWHPGIHAGTKNTKTDGTWTRKRGVADTYYAQVVAELRKTHPAPVAGTPPAGGLALPGVTPTLTLPGATPGLPMLTLPGATPAVVTNYQQLVNFITKNVDQPGRRLTIAYINETFKNNGVANPATLATDEAASATWLAQFRNVLAQIGEVEAV